jgi:tetratricopeptide (TPR) repeat protein
MGNSTVLSKELTLSLCMIVRNEKQNLPRCLESVKPYVDEMIVVDTGSGDGTPEVAIRHGAKVAYFEWCDDFSAARNYAISQASGDWILVLDADEELIVDLGNFRKQIISNPKIIFYSLLLHDVHDSNDRLTPGYVTRLFRKLSSTKYIGRFHEQIYYQNQALSLNDVSIVDGVKILHYGYQKEQLHWKNVNRNIPLLERLWKEEGLSFMLLYSLAQMYTNTQQPEKAQECYVEAFEQLIPSLMNGEPPEEFLFIPALLSSIGFKFIQDKDYETARLICQRGLEWCPDYPPLNYLAGATLIELGLPLGATAYFENCLRMGREESYLKKEPFAKFYISKGPAYALGCTYIDLGEPQEALAAFELALSFDANFTAAREKAEQIKQFLSSQT